MMNWHPTQGVVLTILLAELEYVLTELAAIGLSDDFSLCTPSNFLDKLGFINSNEKHVGYFVHKVTFCNMNNI